MGSMIIKIDNCSFCSNKAEWLVRGLFGTRFVCEDCRINLKRFNKYWQ